MNRSRVVFVAAALLAALAAVPASAQSGKPVQLSLFNPVQIVPESESVSGVRLNLIYGANQDVQGLDLGLVNHTHGSETAFMWGGVNLVEKDFLGYQNSWINITNGKFTGFAWGLFNQAEEGNGLQLGLVNVTQHMHGVQVGVVNMTQTMHGLQVGVGNVIQQGKMKFLPIVNWSM